ncbi:hypothetical protein GA0074692_5288 [Micromonospora pallida]|uniref:Uncharacterized protein n=1 Tax=Micromonospora pallida TaxID=145854 RepID=A0A1C6TBT7_9ACTN|nr:DUF6284 family protein [Micromonospora pallida]SCL39231.1 hypothetical protein GA0074692_5288 [Micromonospora pallida]
MNHDQGPSAADLDAIDVEWPLIAAELDVLDAAISLIYAEDHGGPSAMDWRRVRRAEARVTRTAAELTARQHGHVCRLVEVALTTDCAYGCKVLRCRDCGGEQVSHRAVYGCPVGSSRAA